MRLPNHDRTTLVHPDAMHTITNVITTLVGLLSGNANTSQVLLEEEEFGRREWYRDVQTAKGTDMNIYRLIAHALQMQLYFNLITRLYVHQLLINLLIKLGSKTNKWNTMKIKFNWYLCFIVVDFIHSCHHLLRMGSFNLKINKVWSIDLTCWRSTQQLCLWFFVMSWIWVLERIFGLRAIAVILKILHLFSMWPITLAMLNVQISWTLRDVFWINNCKPCLLAQLAQVASLETKYWIQHHIRNHSTNQIAGNSLFSSEFILITDIIIFNRLFHLQCCAVPDLLGSWTSWLFQFF